MTSRSEHVVPQQRARARLARRRVNGLLSAAALLALVALTACAPSSAQGDGSHSSTGKPGPSGETPAQGYPLHTNIVSTTFWVGEIFDPNASDGSQMISTYDSQWFQHYGGCDGTSVAGTCETEARTAANDYFPTSMTPLLNPFYLDLPFDDVNDPDAFARRAEVIPWANAPEYQGQAQNNEVSMMLNRWVKLIKGDRVCYGQIADAGPGQYNDADYVFGSQDARPQNRKFNGAGMDVSPALNGCLGFSSLNGEDDRVDWQFVEEADVPPGPWLRRVSQGHEVH
ncbi:hypothetical protein [Microterricola viridarii]|uniref:Uncharacterized protein n=1 Tax=Microterricola viridarii TaxID=412690 RepID=A0A120I167_9MICO|nr:hypothetical protein [Microterricola viridarii]AMB59103.1 hypothetical protein AWU67_09810 [Microterricola viridarii]